MTNGIIQEVFKKYLDIGTNSRILDIYLPIIEKELIEKIKQAEKYYCGKPPHISIEELIGDN